MSYEFHTIDVGSVDRLTAIIGCPCLEISLICRSIVIALFRNDSMIFLQFQVQRIAIHVFLIVGRFVFHPIDVGPRRPEKGLIENFDRDTPHNFRQLQMNVSNL